MSKALIEKLRKGREFKLAVGGFTFLLRRPTDVEAVELHRSGGSPAEVAQRFVCGWEGVKEDDLVGGGGMDPVAFDLAMWKEWVADRPDFWAPIADAVLKAYQAHAESLETVTKN